MLDEALAYADGGWEVFPLRGKIPWVAKADGGNGVLDATTNLDRVRAWWSKWPKANIGGRVPPGLMLIDTDPRNGGDLSLAELERVYGALPETLTCLSGRGDGGAHRYFRHPGGEITARRLGQGIDLKTHAGYGLLPPSVHPDSGKPYGWVDGSVPVIPSPAWFVDLLRPAPRAVIASSNGHGRPTHRTGSGVIADMKVRLSWSDLLGARGWKPCRNDGNCDGSGWLHPAASSDLSATVREGRLYVYSPNTPFEPTEAGNPRGYDLWDAWVLLEHRGDVASALKAAKERLDGRAA